MPIHSQLPLGLFERERGVCLDFLKAGQSSFFPEELGIRFIVTLANVLNGLRPDYLPKRKALRLHA